VLPKKRELPETDAECLPMFITMHLLVIFRSPWNKQGRWMLGSTGVSEFKSKDLLPLLTSNGHQGFNDEVIEEGNLPFSRWISKVASTGVSLSTTCKFLSRQASIHSRGSESRLLLERGPRLRANS
jgi:hypothetical protein